jgi:hypothetical protein
MTLSARQLNRTTLARQLLLDRAPLDVPEGVRRVGALQAQEPVSPYVALWSRLADLDAADLDAAFTAGEVVKASLLRLTLHAVHADDHPAFHSAMLPSLRASRLRDRRYTSTGLTVDDADALLPDVLRFLEQPRSRDEIEALLEERLGEPQPRAWWALRMFAPLHHVPTGPPWSFGGGSAFVAAPVTEPEPHDLAVQRVVVRYLEAFGPASVRDIAQCTMLRTPVLTAALHALGDDIEEVGGPEATTLYDVAGAATAPEDVAAPPRLLPMWDSILLAYSDRSRVLPPDHRPLIIRRNGDVLPTLLVDGYVAGVWRTVDGGIEVTAFHRLHDDVWEGVAEEARGLLSFLGERAPTVYRRYARWWDTLPSEEVRVLPA